MEEATISSNTLVNFYQNTRRQIAVDSLYLFFVSQYKINNMINLLCIWNTMYI
jgi:hypothetical protein